MAAMAELGKTRQFTDDSFKVQFKELVRISLEAVASGVVLDCIM